MLQAISNPKNFTQLAGCTTKASEVAFGDATWHRERVARLFNP
jgi:hypothetical protein